MNSRTKQKILEKYLLIVKEFFLLIHESHIMKELNYPISSIQIGLQTIHRVLEYIFTKTQNIDNAYFYAQKTYYYYLEYMEQIHESNLSLNLNHIDAVLFVYKKTIIEFQEKTEHDTSSSMTNIMTLQNEYSKEATHSEIAPFFQKIERIVNNLFFWNHPEFEFLFLRQIVDLYMTRAFQKIDKFSDFALTIIEFVQEKRGHELPTSKYLELVEEIIVRAEKNTLMEKRTKKGDMVEEAIETKKNNLFLEKYYANKEGFSERFDQGKMADFVTWMYS